MPCIVTHLPIQALGSDDTSAMVVCWPLAGEQTRAAPCAEALAAIVTQNRTISAGMSLISPASTRGARTDSGPSVVERQMTASLTSRRVWGAASGILGALLFTISCEMAAVAQAKPSAPQAEKPAFVPPRDSVAMMHLQAKMRDGVRLDTSVWLPKAEGKFPVVLVRTPYRTEMGAFQTTLLQSGYAVVEQHERGRYLSEGDMHMLGRADEDGWDTLEWITHQTWSNGKIATYGCSSS